MQTVQRLKIDRGLISEVAGSLADEMSKKMYHKLLMLRFLPEVKLIENGKLRALKGGEINKFFAALSSSR
jgi:hypothetical protein